MTGATYVCAVCGETCRTIRPEAEANAEARDLFGVPHASTDPTMAIVCDDCWKKHHREWEAIHEDQAIHS